jgi:hypothetical protein
MATGTESQEHPLADGRTTIINRNGRHQYWIGDGPKMSSVTSMLGHLDSGGFGVGMGWALKVAREAGGDLEAPGRVSKEARDQGNLLHDAIDNFISEGIVDEESPLFVAWLNEVGNHHAWVASEQFLYHPEYRYGGTADAFSDSAIFDWKSKDSDSYAKYGGSLSDIAQLGAYAMALQAMGSTLARDVGYIAYVMRDGSGVDVVKVDLNHGWALFEASHKLYTLTRELRDGR